jgi:hypothetical protein
MPVGTTLVALRQMLNVEAGEEMDETISPARVAINNALLNNQQAFLDNQHTFLRGKVVVTLAATVGTQYYDLPNGIDFDRLESDVYTNVVNFRYRMTYGITQDDYNIYRSDQRVVGAPCFKWQLINTTKLQIELWPIPSVAQTIYFTGVMPLVAMVADTDPCVIDDMALVLFTAAEVLARKGAADASAKGAKAKAYLDNLRGSFPSRYSVFNMAGQAPRVNGFDKNTSGRPVVAVSTP